MNNQIVKVLSGNSDSITKDIQDYLSSECLAPSHIISMGIFPYPAILPTLPSGFGIVLRHLPANQPTSTNRCKVSFVKEGTLSAFGSRMQYIVNDLDTIVAQAVISLGNAHAWIAISKKVD